MPLIRVKKLHPEARIPKYAHVGPFGDLAADLFAVEAVTLAAAGSAGATALVATGLALAFPADYGALVEDRSGLAVKGLTTLAGVIDPGYRGEIKVVVTNLNPVPFPLKAGDRVAQLRIVQRIQAEFEETDELDETVRSAGGFGSTGR